MALQCLSLLQPVLRPLGAVQQQGVWQRIARLFEAIPKHCSSNPCSCGSGCPLILVCKMKKSTFSEPQNSCQKVKREGNRQPYPDAFSCVLYGEGSALAPHPHLIQSWVLSYRLRGHTMKECKCFCTFHGAVQAKLYHQLLYVYKARPKSARLKCKIKSILITS